MQQCRGWESLANLLYPCILALVTALERARIWQHYDLSMHVGSRSCRVASRALRYLEHVNSHAPLIPIQKMPTGNGALQDKISQRRLGHFSNALLHSLRRKDWGDRLPLDPAPMLQKPHVVVGIWLPFLLCLSTKILLLSLFSLCPYHLLKTRFLS